MKMPAKPLKLLLRLSITMISLACMSQYSLAQVRYLPHVTKLDSDYQTWIILENTTTEDVIFELQPYAETGARTPSVLGLLTPGEVAICKQGDLLGHRDAAYFTIGSDMYPAQGMNVSVAYGLKSEEGSPAYHYEATTASKRYRLYAGNWPQVFDAIAVVNLGNEPATVRVKHVSLMGDVLQEVVIAEDLAPMAKVATIIGGYTSVFERSASPIFEIEATMDVGLMALQGDLPTSRPIWSNPVRAIP